MRSANATSVLCRPYLLRVCKSISRRAQARPELLHFSLIKPKPQSIGFIFFDLTLSGLEDDQVKTFIEFARSRREMSQRKAQAFKIRLHQA